MSSTPTKNERDYNLISPSARSLILLKGLTRIPFATDTAKLISQPEEYNPDMNNPDHAFWKRVVHFELRYWSVDQLLSDLTATNILELSSGYSFRGLDMVQRHPIHYIDTDLPDVISRKEELMKALQPTLSQNPGRLELKPLNALHEKQVNDIVTGFSPGPIVIVNEGLMMYLNSNEKTILCNIIHALLAKRGGCWITADIYIKSTLERLNQAANDSLKELIEQQKIEENMFDSFDAAEHFFRNVGFVVEKEAALDLSKVTSINYLIKTATPDQLKEMQTNPKKIQATWRLRIAE